MTLLETFMVLNLVFPSAVVSEQVVGKINITVSNRALLYYPAD
jgi:hypothetical protein